MAICDSMMIRYDRKCSILSNLKDVHLEIKLNFLSNVMGLSRVNQNFISSTTLKWQMVKQEFTEFQKSWKFLFLCFKRC